MGKLQEFKIAFEKNKEVYSPGESISGTVTVKLGQQLQCKGKSHLRSAEGMHTFPFKFLIPGR
uniref:Arrestin-like N-terminal domain-containing protein n=1 Tax=Pundamilia nyererei TaxID=303518 RepID=A0A3B4F8B3_9CICH